MRPKKKVRQEDIAQELGISVVSVSNALSGKKGVSDELREQVIGKAAQMGYHTSAVSRRKAGRALRAAAFSSSYRNRMIDLLAENSSDYGIQIEAVRCAGGTLSSFERPDLIFFTQKLEEDMLYQLLSRYDVPAVAVGYFDSHIPIDYVLPDFMHNAVGAVLHLFQLGHTSIAFAGRGGKGGEAELDCRMGFLNGTARFLRTSVFDESRCYDSTQEAVRAVTGLSSLSRPTAIVCADNDTALLLIRDLGQYGCKVPGDVSVISCDSRPLGELTRFSCSERELVRESLRIANDRLRNNVHCEGVTAVAGKLSGGHTAARRSNG